MIDTYTLTRQITALIGLGDQAKAGCIRDWKIQSLPGVRPNLIDGMFHRSPNSVAGVGARVGRTGSQYQRRARSKTRPEGRAWTGELAVNQSEA
jgi:hypothetical protein